MSKGVRKEGARKGGQEERGGDERRAGYVGSLYYVPSVNTSPPSAKRNYKIHVTSPTHCRGGVCVRQRKATGLTPTLPIFFVGLGVQIDGP